jgi:pyruvyltransferase
MKEKINLLYFEEKVENGNFGDELSRFIISELINKNKYELVFNQPNIEKNIIGIGSYLHAAVNNYYIYGTGIRTNPPVEGSHGYTKLNVCSVRGPITHDFLGKKKIKCQAIYGDPALLLRDLYKPELITNLKDKIAFIPHKSNYNKYLNENKYDKNKFHLINPRQKWSDVVNQIYSCKSTVSSSLHGLIVADAYDKPNVMIYEYELAEGDLKFKDYYTSQKRGYINIKNLEKFQEKFLYKGGNKIDLEKLKDAFPFK